MRRMVVERSDENDAGEAQQAVVPGVPGDAAGRRARPSRPWRQGRKAMAGGAARGRAEGGDGSGLLRSRREIEGKMGSA